MLRAASRWLYENYGAPGAFPSSAVPFSGTRTLMGTILMVYSGNAYSTSAPTGTWSYFDNNNITLFLIIIIMTTFYNVALDGEEALTFG